MKRIRISDLKKEVSNNKTRVSVQLSLGKITKKLYIEVDSIFTRSIDYSAFLVMTLMPAMKSNSDIAVSGNISKKLSRNVLKAMKLLNSWDKSFKVIKVESEGFTNSKKSRTKSASFMSCGVDSFSTMLQNDHEISYLLLGHGFDVELNDLKRFSQVKDSAKIVAKVKRKSLVTFETNLRSFSDDFVNWDWEHGPALAAVSILLSQLVGFGKVFLSGPHSKDQLVPLGLHPTLDKFWETEQLDIVHDGLDLTRFEKIDLVLSNSDLALSNLRVCWENLGDRLNCGSCNKCLRTMIDLQICGLLEKANLFPKNLDLMKVAKILSPSSDTIVFFEDSFKRTAGRNDLKELRLALATCLKNSKNPPLSYKMLEYLRNSNIKKNILLIDKIIFSGRIKTFLKSKL